MMSISPRFIPWSRRSPVIHASASFRGFVQRVDFSDFAAELAVLDAFVKKVHAMLSDHSSDFSDVGIVNFNFGVVSSRDAIHKIVRLFEESHGV